MSETQYSMTHGRKLSITRGPEVKANSSRLTVVSDVMMKLDLEYARNRGLGEDISRIVRTLRVMLSGDGAA